MNPHDPLKPLDCPYPMQYFIRRCTHPHNPATMPQNCTLAPLGYIHPKQALTRHSKRHNAKNSHTSPCLLSQATRHHYTLRSMLYALHQHTITSPHCQRQPGAYQCQRQRTLHAIAQNCTKTAQDRLGGQSPSLSVHDTSSHYTLISALITARQVIQRHTTGSAHTVRKRYNGTRQRIERQRYPHYVAVRDSGERRCLTPQKCAAEFTLRFWDWETKK
jgi:hypothetical protein